MLRVKSVEENKNGRKYQEDQWPMPIEQLRYYKKQTKGWSSLQREERRKRKKD